jgi:proteic killer suppression protein
MISNFKNLATEDIFNGVNSKSARKLCPQELWKVATRKLDQLDSIMDVEELRVPPGNMLEKLLGDKKDLYSLRINQQYRICFEWKNLSAYNVEIIDYH